MLNFLRIFFFTHLLFWGIFISAKGQSAEEVEFLPQGRLFDPLFLDPIESQSFLTFSPFYRQQGRETAPTAYIPFSFGFYKGIWRWNKKDRAYELGFDAAAFPQFEWKWIDKKLQRNLLNTDYKVSLVFHYAFRPEFVLRARFFHLSSHLGDDYLIRNGVNSYIPNPVNYEQLDLTLSTTRKWGRFYGGLGMVVRPNTIRKRFSVQSGINVQFGSGNAFRYIGGLDVKVLEQNNYRPNVKTGAGVAIGKTENKPLRFILEYYNGHLPYSVFEFETVQWLGAGLYLDIF